MPSSANHEQEEDEPDCPPSQLPNFKRHPSNIGSHSRQSSLLEEITAHRREKLRRTNIPHTPGGTPVRSKHHHSASSHAHGDILQRALKRKFRSIHIHSTPKRHGRGNRESRGSSSISECGSVECSSVWSEGGEVGYASDPDISLNSYSEVQTRSAADLVMDVTSYPPSPGVSLQDEED